MNEIECETCIKRKTIYCPNHGKCFGTKNKPYYQNKIMLLKENEEFKNKIDKAIEYNRNQIKDIKDFYRNTKDRIYSGDTIIEIAEQNIEILKGDSDE